MVRTAPVERVICGLSRATAEWCRAEIEAAGLGPVEIRRASDSSGTDCILDVRIGPFRRTATTEAEVLALLEERQACFF